MLLSSKLNKILLGLILIPMLSYCSQGEKEDPGNNKQKGRTLNIEGELSFVNPNGEVLTTIEIAIADEPLERNQGLMDVNSMPENTGMLFIFEREDPKSFYMANTPLPLDIMYVNSDSVIVRIYQNTTPFSSTSLPSEIPAQYVVETNAGFSIAHGITEGVKIQF